MREPVALKAVLKNKWHKATFNKPAWRRRVLVMLVLMGGTD